MSYCDRECQRKHWGTHKTACAGQLAKKQAKKERDSAALKAETEEAARRKAATAKARAIHTAPAPLAPRRADAEYAQKGMGLGISDSESSDSDEADEIVTPGAAHARSEALFGLD